MEVSDACLRGIDLRRYGRMAGTLAGSAVLPEPGAEFVEKLKYVRKKLEMVDKRNGQVYSIRVGLWADEKSD